MWYSWRSCDHTTLSLLQQIHKGVCKVNSKVKCVQEQLCVIATKFPEIKEEMDKVQASWMDSDDKDDA